MSLGVTLILMALAAGVFVLSAWRSGQPSNPLRPRMIPWTLLALASGVFFLTLLTHLFSLFGLQPQNRMMPV